MVASEIAVRGTHRNGQEGRHAHMRGYLRPGRYWLTNASRHGRLDAERYAKERELVDLIRYEHPEYKHETKMLNRMLKESRRAPEVVLKVEEPGHKHPDDKVRRIRKHVILAAVSAVFSIPGIVQEYWHFLGEGDFVQTVRRILAAVAIPVMVNSVAAIGKHYAKKYVERELKRK